MALASIVGQSEWDTLTTCFRAKRLRAGGGGATNRFDDLWCDWETRAVCRFVSLTEGSIRLICQGRRVHARLYRRKNGLIDHTALDRVVRAGASLNLPRVEDYSNRVLALTRELERSFGHAVQANLYLTPGRGRGLGLHCDPHDVLVLQLRGRKQWEFEHAPAHVVLPGDWLYVPTSVRHAAHNGADERSAHLSLGFHPVTPDAVWDNPRLPCAVRFVQYQTPVPAGDVPVGNAAAIPDDRARFEWRGERGSVRRTATALAIDLPYRRAPLEIRLDAADAVERMIGAGVFGPATVATGSIDDAKLLCGLLTRVGVLGIV